MVNENSCLLAIFCITVLGLACVAQNLNGQILALVIIAVAGLGGYEVYKKVKDKDVVV